jgi:glutathione S-transferase
MTIVITAFERSPDGGMGLARDTRVRWALEEVGQPYEVRLVSLQAREEPAHLRLHPFGLIPTYEEGDLALFERGAIIFHIAERHAGLFSDDANARARAITWMFAAINTVEPPILELVTARFAEGDKPWTQERLPLVKDRIRDRLVQVSARLGDADWLDGAAFCAGDLMMVSVLLRLRPSGLLDEFPKLAAYVSAAKRGPRTNGPSPRNGRSTPGIRKLADEVPHRSPSSRDLARGHPTARPKFCFARRAASRARL